MHISLRKQFGDRVRELRKAAGFTQEEFADLCGYARTYLSRIETGGANVSLDAIEVLSAALAITPSELLSFAPAEAQGQGTVRARQHVVLAKSETAELHRRRLTGGARPRYAILHDEEPIPDEPKR
ncbi:helix-turn-helix domain-containing protein [Alcaligenes faecalis]|uniref:helix-turn-helix domain-containing protein n=1 Tax=Alcaligenes faecalis TaxID=511 RepID=UPI00122C6024|nr:helix-turn-helix transcriptional regulator [Alcaligenes faecalis]KAA1288466.1 XRE family transcriptional regulator [Alcaligenes faecalis]